MRLSAIKIYVSGILGCSILAIALLDWTTLAQFSLNALMGAMVLTLLGIISESLAISVRVGDSSGTSSVTFIPLLTCVLLFGPPAAVVLVGISGVVGEFLIRKKEPIRGIFNISQWLLGVAAGGAVYTMLGGTALALLPEGHVGSIGTQIVPFAIFGAIFVLMNHTATALAIAIDQRLSFRWVFASIMGRPGSNLLNDILVSPIAIAVAFFYIELNITGLLVALFPLLFIRYSYLNNDRLQRANRDLLKALVKAIETRDPYTSGHSLRVAMLAKQIARELGINGPRLDYLETAALLHDIGKIEAIYSEILKKPATLTDQEREIIQSHVAKGVELLRSLSSFPNEVILAVRHHHERMDGGGCPDGIGESAIPMGAKIIMTCDAIDAMLSDRPYRRALTLEQVREQLAVNSGTQFAPEVVRWCPADS